MSKSGGPAAGASPAVAATVPPAIPEALRRPLTIEQICALPPATRDMILKAQGRPNACDSLKKK
ncbi:MAG TPA: hypothetical protein VNQ79_03565 [Blastocatellia bacterium]|nr:hypothetical protein [Blastocatellia bacterium]